MPLNSRYLFQMCIGYSTIETKEADRIGYNGFLFLHEYSGEGRGATAVYLCNRNYSAILATLQITSYALGVYIALLFTSQLHESLIKLYFKQFSIFQLKF